MTFGGNWLASSESLVSHLSIRRIPQGAPDSRSVGLQSCVQSLCVCNTVFCIFYYEWSVKHLYIHTCIDFDTLLRAIDNNGRLAGVFKDIIITLFLIGDEDGVFRSYFLSLWSLSWQSSSPREIQKEESAIGMMNTEVSSTRSSWPCQQFQQIEKNLIDILLVVIVL